MIIDKIAEMENLKAAWGKVRSKKPPPGIDRISWEAFEKDLAFNLAKIQKQIKEQTYQPLPVVVYKDTRSKKTGRNIGISAMRDKVVQQAVLRAIGPYFERIFLPCSYAYRPGRSAILAVNKVSQLIRDGNLWALQMDIKDFFDNLDHGILLDEIRAVISEKPVIRLISRLLKSKIFREMGLFDNVSGSHQGSGLSPFLSNIYLHPLDKVLWSRCKDRYLRYSDDIIVLGTDKEPLEHIKCLIEECLERLKLGLNPNKTFITHVATGIVYLGFFLDSSGKGPDKKSVKQLQMKLGEYEKVRKTDDVSKKIEEAITVIRGWYSYYRTLKPVVPENIISLIALVRLAQEFGELQLAKRLLKEGSNQRIKHPGISFQLGGLFEGLGMRNQAMRQYAQALQLDPDMEVAKEKIRGIQEGEKDIYKAIEKIQHVLHFNPHYREGYERLVEYYTELGLYGFAEKAQAKVLELDAGGPETADISQGETKPSPFGQEDLDFDYRQVDIEVFMDLFKGRNDAHAKQWVDERGRWGFMRVERGIKKKDILKHLRGEETLAVYPVTKRDTVFFIVFDVDTARRVIIESGASCPEAFIKKAHEDILRLKTVCEQMGLPIYIEDSGYKGRHGWLFFSKEVPAVKAIQLGHEIMKTAGGPSKGMCWELFPMGKSERHKSAIKLPLGINRKNNRRCLFLADDNIPFPDQSLYLRTIKRVRPDEIRKADAHRLPSESDMVDYDQGMSPGLRKMIENCKVIKHLISKARDTNYLNHYERVCLLYTLTFAGEEGCRLLHKVISHCINYDFNFTQHQIERRKENPMSCMKIMENFPELAETLPCNCKFDLPPRGYPSPVLYLLEAEMERADGLPFPGKAKEEMKTGERAKTDEGDQEEVPLLDFDEIFSAEAIDGVEKDPGKGPEDEGSEGPRTEIQRKGKGCPIHPGTDEAKDFSIEAWGLFKEYLRLTLQLEETRRELIEAEKRLSQIFDEHGDEILFGQRGNLKRRIKSNGRTQFIVTIG